MGSRRSRLLITILMATVICFGGTSTTTMPICSAISALPRCRIWTKFPRPTSRSTTFGLNHTAVADLDGDNDLDIIVGAANGNDINNLVLLRNNGTPTSPSYAVLDSNIIHGIDVGSYAIPALADLDDDGDMDLLIGRGDGRLTHFENTGTATSPVFVLTSDFYKSIDVGLSSAPALVDWDDDGDFDLLIGSETGRDCSLSQ